MLLLNRPQITIMKLNGRFILFTVFLVLIATACKYYFGPDLDMSGFSPVIAIALFSGMIIKQRGASFLLPLLALFISDALIEVFYQQGLFPYGGFYSGQWKNYVLLLLSTLIGWGLKGNTYTSLLVGAIAAPTAYFLVSNFMVWTGGHVSYPRDFNGLMTCYAAGLPFYKNALIGMFVFLPVILFTYNYLVVQRKQLVLS